MTGLDQLEKLLEATGFTDEQPEHFECRDIVLRDGRAAKLWLNREDGHGILDRAFWESETYYQEQYRQEFSAHVDTKTKPKEHLSVYKETNLKQFEMFADRIDARTKYLEVGCSFGGVLQHVAASQAKLVHGVEPNIEDAEFVRSHLSNTQIYNTYLEDAPLQDTYSLIASFEVLEHATNPHLFVQKIVSHLEPDGFINIEVPNHHDALIHCYKDSGYKNFYYHKAHIHYFTPRSLHKLFARAGIQGEVKGFQMYPYTNQIHWLYNHTPMKSAHLALNVVPKFNTDTRIIKELSAFIEKTVEDYAALVSNLLVSDCLVFQGSRTN